MRVPKWRLLIAFIATVFACASAQAQLNGKETGIRTLSKAWGFFQGQLLRLDRIERNHPDLQGAVLIARNEFKGSFPDLEANAERSFRSWGAKEEEITNMRKTVMDTILPMIEQEPIDRASALDLVEAVKQRAKGIDIPEDIVQYLLATAFMDRPELELTRGWRAEYNSRNHPKAKGVTVLLKPPRSFKQEEGDRPNIVSKWTSEAGNGLEMLMLIVLNSDEKALTRKEIDDDIRLGDRSEIKRSFKGTGQILSLRPFSQERAAGYIVDIQSESDRAGLEITLRQRQFVLFIPGRAVSFSCQVAARRDSAASLESKMSRFGELCRGVANSLVLPQQYIGGK